MHSVPFDLALIGFLVSLLFCFRHQRRWAERARAELGKAGQAISNAEECLADLSALEKERAQLIAAAAELGERVRVLTAAVNVLHGESVTYAKTNHARPLQAARMTWESVRDKKA